MSPLAEAVGYGGDAFALLFLGWLAGWANVGFIDSKRRHEAQRAEDVQREAALEVARTAQAARGDYTQVAS